MWTPKSWREKKKNLKKQNALRKNIKYHPGEKIRSLFDLGILRLVLSFYVNCKQSGNGQPSAFRSAGSSIQSSVLRAATCGSGMDGLLFPPHPCPPRASERWTRPKEAQNSPSWRAAGGDGQGDHCPSWTQPRGLSPRAPGSEGFSRDLVARPGLRTHVSLVHLSNNPWARKEPGATGGSGGTHQIMRNGLYQVALCHCPSWSEPPCGPLSEYLNPG